jgi:hypothetical protein
MFVSFKCNEYLGRKNGKSSWKYELTDSEFGTVSDIMDNHWFWTGVWIAVIQEYSKRKLNVAANLALAFHWWQKQHPDCSIQRLIDDNKSYPLSPLSQYEKDLQKYLVLL